MTEVLERPRVASPAARTVTPARSRRGGGSEHAPRRMDIEGLRAVAVLGVLAFHAGLPFVPGGYVGVDVFFVISGYLITGLVATEVELTGRLSLGRFYARRIKRLLPAAALVLVVTAIASSLILSPLGREQAGGDITSAALYVSNWHFALQQTDYLSVQANPSPVLHYWSLSVEEQYYVLWPLVLLLTVLLARRYRLVTRRAVQIAVILVGLVSLAWSLLWTTANPPFAFFGLMTRAWELALGGAIALGAVGLSRLGRWPRALLGWGGLVSIVAAMALMTEETPFPGTAALIPVLGAGAVIVAGLPRPDRHARPAPDLGPVRALGITPMRGVGRVSYSLYLWHWPPLVLVPIMLDRPLTPMLGVLIVLAACVPALLSYRYVEEPFRHSRALVSFPGRAAAVAVVLTAVAVLAGTLAATSAPDPQIQVQVTKPRGVVETVRVDPDAAREDLPSMYADGCQGSFDATTSERCLYGDKESPRRMALLGDSHAAQWFPALLPLAKRYGFALEIDSKGSCSAADVLQWEQKNIGGVYDTCVTFRNRLLDAWQQDPGTRPDVVVVASRDLLTVMSGDQKMSRLNSLQAMRDGLVRTFDRLRGMGIQVVVIRDTLATTFDVPDCLAQHSTNPARCAFAADGAAPVLAADVDAAAAAGVPVVDLSAEQCPDGSCAPIIDGRIVYRDSHHLTASFVRTLADEVRDQLEPTPAWGRLTSS